MTLTDFVVTKIIRSLSNHNDDSNFIFSACVLMSVGNVNDYVHDRLTKLY